LAHVPLVLIHAFPFDSRMWRHLLPALKWRASAWDLVGVGSARGFESPDDYSMAAYARSTVDVLDLLGQDPEAVFCGVSMGGYIIFELLRQFPQRVRAVILCNTKATPDTPEAKRSRNALVARTLNEGMSAVVDELVNRLLARVTRERRPEVVSEVRQMILDQKVPGIVGALHALRDRPDSTPLLGQIQVPVLVIAGDDDQIAPAAGMQEMARAIPGAQLVVIPESGHLTPIEQPRRVGAAINDFLEQL